MMGQPAGELVEHLAIGDKLAGHLTGGAMHAGTPCQWGSRPAEEKQAAHAERMVNKQARLDRQVSCKHACAQGTLCT